MSNTVNIFVASTAPNTKIVLRKESESAEDAIQRIGNELRLVREQLLSGDKEAAHFPAEGLEQINQAIDLVDQVWVKLYL